MDGVTSTALLVETLQQLNANVRGYIPNRFEEGYGLNNNALDELKADGVQLVITVDCGILSPSEALHAQTIGLDLIISDHHHPAQGDLPPAFAVVINTKQPGDVYPDKDLAGAGIAYKIAEALLSIYPSAFSLDSPARPCRARDRGGTPCAAGRRKSYPGPQGTSGKCVKPHGRDYLRLRRCQRSSWRSQRGEYRLFAGAALPNAAGRLKEALAAFELLTTKDVFRAGELAQVLDMQNRKRQCITKDMQKRAEEIAIGEDPHAFLLFAAQEDFNSGVIGLAASRLTDTYYRPAIVQISKGRRRPAGRAAPSLSSTLPRRSIIAPTCSPVTEVMPPPRDLLSGARSLRRPVSRLKAYAKEKLSNDILADGHSRGVCLAYISAQTCSKNV